MADGAVKAKAQQAMLQDKAKKAVEKYMEAEKKYLERLSKLADKDGFVTKDDYMTLMIIKDEYLIPINYCDVMCISIKWGVVEVID